MDIQDYLELLTPLVTNRFTDWYYLVISGFCVLVLLISFHRHGYRAAWPRGLRESVITNLSFWWGNILFMPLVLLAYQVVEMVFEQSALPRLSETLWHGVPFWLLGFWGIFLKDFADYWNHRALHHRWLWPIHAIHHSDTHLNPLTTYRVHFLEPFVMYVSYLLIMGWLNLPAAAIGFGAIVLMLHNMYIHINVDWGHGPFKYLVSSPRMHQWHHADVPEAHGKNLANVFPVFDILFGTYYVPGPCNEHLGASGVPENNFIKLTAFPFALWGRAVLAKLHLTRPVKNSA